jgi:hypothetical protein
VSDPLENMIRAVEHRANLSNSRTQQMGETSKNDITGDRICNIKTGGNNTSYKSGWDLLWGGKDKPQENCYNSDTAGPNGQEGEVTSGEQTSG